MRTLFLFAMAGGVATGTHYAILITLVHLGEAPVTATSLGALSGSLINYGLNRRYAFRSRRAHLEALPRYLVTAGAGWALNGMVVGMIAGQRVHYLVAQSAATGLVFLWNFFVNRWWTFRGEDYAR